MDYLVTIAPLHEPVSLAQAKRHLRVEQDDDDTLIAAYVAAARSWCEGYAHRAFLYQKVTAYADDFAEVMELPLTPVLAVESLTYVDDSGATQTVAPALYQVDTSTGRIVLDYNQTWPSCRGYYHDVTVTYQAGYAQNYTCDTDDDGNSILVVPGHTYRANDAVMVYSDGDVPDGLDADTVYYVKTVAGHNVTLAESEGGATVILGDDGSGTNYIDALPQHCISALLLRLADLWSNRGDEDLPLSRSIRDLLDLDRMVSL
jgi:uncharacterized phiE125 gp8 family phage protein